MHDHVFEQAPVFHAVLEQKRIHVFDGGSGNLDL